MAKARIVIVNFNAGENLSRCMAALLGQSERDFEVKIVDNASADGSLQYVPDDDRFSVIRAGGNIGFAAGSNLGAKENAAPFVVFLNPDAFPEPTWLHALFSAAEEYPDAAMFGSLQLNAADLNIFDGAGDCYSCFGTSWRGGYNRPVRPLPNFTETFSPCAAAAMYRADWFERVDGFDEAFFCYIEDVDLGFRVRLLGGRCLQVNNAVVHHVGSATAGTDTEFTIYHGTRNQFWTAVKNCPGLLLCVFVPLQFALNGYSIFRMGKLSPAIIRGLRDGIADLARVWRQRAELQRARIVSVWSIARMINWSISDLRSRALSLRPWRSANLREP